MLGCANVSGSQYSVYVKRAFLLCWLQTREFVRETAQGQNADKLKKNRAASGTIYISTTGADPEGGWGERVRIPLPNEKSQGYRVPEQYWPGSKLPCQHSMLGHYRPARETPF